MNCSIIIRSFNEERHIGRLIEGIKQQRLPIDFFIEIILVDSGSTDSTVLIATSLGAKVIKVSKEEFSFGRALNIGCAVANSEILIFASAHVYPVFTNWIEKMIAPFSSKDVGLVYGRQTGNEQTYFSEQQIFNKWFPGHSNFNQVTPFCNNANCAIRKKLWEQQSYDESLTGLEDLDWGKKIMAKGHAIVYEANAVVVHVHEETPQKIKNRYQREAIALKCIFPKVHFSFLDFIYLLSINVVCDSWQALRKGVLLKEGKFILVFRYMQFLGTYLGHRYKGGLTKELKNMFYYPPGISEFKPMTSETFQCERHKKIEYN